MIIIIIYKIIFNVFFSVMKDFFRKILSLIVIISILNWISFYRADSYRVDYLCESWTKVQINWETKCRDEKPVPKVGGNMYTFKRSISGFWTGSVRIYNWTAFSNVSMREASFFNSWSTTRRAHQLWIQLYRWVNESSQTPVNGQWWEFTKTINVPNWWRAYIIGMIWDDDWYLKIDWVTKIHSPRWYLSYTLYPIFLSGWEHTLKFWYNDTSWTWWVAFEIVWPFNKSDLFNWDSLKPSSDIKSFIESWWSAPHNLEKWGTVEAPKNYVSKILWSTHHSFTNKYDWAFFNLYSNWNFVSWSPSWNIVPICESWYNLSPSEDAICFKITDPIENIYYNVSFRNENNSEIISKEVLKNNKIDISDVTQPSKNWYIFKWWKKEWSSNSFNFLTTNITEDLIFKPIFELKPTWNISYHLSNIIYNTNTWTNSDVEVRLTTNKDFNNIPWWTSINWSKRNFRKILAQNWNETFRITDSQWNQSDEITYNVTKIDKSLPVCWVDWSLNPTWPSKTKNDVIATLAWSTDVWSWIASWQNYSCTILQNNSRCNFVLTDVAWNIATCESPIVDYIDKEKPTATVTYEPNNWTNWPITVNLQANEDIEDLSWWVKVDSRNFKKVFQDNTNQEETVIITDLAWNISLPISYNVKKIDKEAPVCWAWGKSTDTLTNWSIVFTLNWSSDAKSWLNNLVNNNCSVSVYNWTCNVIIQDNAWNSKICNSPLADNIDNDDPEVSEILNQNWKVTKEFSFTLPEWTDRNWISRISITQLPDWLNFSSQTRVISWLPSSAWETQVTVTYFDPAWNQTAKTFKIIISVLDKDQPNNNPTSKVQNIPILTQDFSAEKSINTSWLTEVRSYEWLEKPSTDRIQDWVPWKVKVIYNDDSFDEVNITINVITKPQTITFTWEWITKDPETVNYWSRLPTPEKPIRSWYRFLWWKKVWEQDYYNFDSIVTEDFTLNWEWQREFRVEFKTEDLTQTILTKIVHWWKINSNWVPDQTKEGWYRFLWWRVNGEEELFDFFSREIVSDLVLVPKFKEIEKEKIVLNEISYRVNSSLEDWLDYIELYNPTNFPINISWFSIVNSSDVINIPENSEISQKWYYIIANNSDEFFTKYNFRPNFSSDKLKLWYNIKTTDNNEYRIIIKDKYWRDLDSHTYQWNSDSSLNNRNICRLDWENWVFINECQQTPNKINSKNAPTISISNDQVIHWWIALEVWDLTVSDTNNLDTSFEYSIFWESSFEILNWKLKFKEFETTDYYNPNKNSYNVTIEVKWNLWAYNKKTFNIKVIEPKYQVIYEFKNLTPTKNFHNSIVKPENELDKPNWYSVTPLNLSNINDDDLDWVWYFRWWNPAQWTIDKSNITFVWSWEFIPSVLVAWAWVQKPDNYVEVRFVSAVEKWEIVWESTYYVNPDKEVTLSAPNVTAKTWYKHTWWSEEIRSKRYSQETTINATFEEISDFVNGDQLKPSWYVTVTFTSEITKWELSWVTSYHVNPGKEVTLSAPNVTTKTWYEFLRWNKSLSWRFSEATTIEAEYNLVKAISENKTVYLKNGNIPDVSEFIINKENLPENTSFSWKDSTPSKNINSINSISQKIIVTYPWDIEEELDVVITFIDDIEPTIDDISNVNVTLNETITNISIVTSDNILVTSKEVNWLPTWLTFDNWVISWTVDKNSKARDYEISIIARDEAWNEATKNFKITVQNQATKYTPETKKQIVEVKNLALAQDSISNKDNLPVWTSFSWQTEPNLEVIWDDVRALVLVTYPDNSTEIIEVLFKVQDTLKPEINIKKSFDAFTANSHTINILASDNYNLTSLKYWYSSTNDLDSCKNIDSYIDLANWDDILLTDSSKNWKYVCIEANDSSGNKNFAILPNPVNLDRNNPIWEISYSTKDWTNKDVIVTLTTNKDIQRPDQWEWTWRIFTKVISENIDTTNFTVTDLFWNVSENISYKVANIDKNEPICWTFSANIITPTRENIIMTLNNSSDDLSWIVDNQTTTCEITENNQSCSITLTDNAWNTKICQSPIVRNIDRIAPVLSIDADVKTPTNWNVILTLTVNEDIEIPNWWSKWVISNKFTKTFESNQMVNIEIRDRAWNTSNISYEITNIDKDIPEWEISWEPTDWTKESITLTLRTTKDVETPDWWDKVDDRTFTKIIPENTNWTFKVTDKIGNSSVDITYTVWKIDKKKPSITSLRAENDITLISWASVTINFTWEDNSWNDSSWVKWYKCKIWDWQFVNCSSTFTFDNLVEWENLITVVAIDNAWNESDNSTINITKDTTSPVITIENKTFDEDIAITSFHVQTDWSDDIVKLTDLPNSLSFNPQTKIISWIPIQPWVYTVVVSAVDRAKNKSTKTFTITINDTTAPEISLTWWETITLVKWKKYTELWASCIDNFDENCSVNIEWTIDNEQIWEQIITYKARDKAWNESSKTRKVTVVSWDVPVINIIWETNIEVELWWTYTDAWATAEDNEDWDITESIKTTNLVDTSKLWTYKVSYNVSDKSWNSASEMIRTVTVKDTTKPDILGIENKSFDEKISINPILIEVTDLNPSLTINVSWLPDWLVFNSTNKQIEWKTTEVWDHEIIVKAIDGSWNFSEEKFIITINDKNSPIVTIWNLKNITKSNVNNFEISWTCSTWDWNVKIIIWWEKELLTSCDNWIYSINSDLIDILDNENLIITAEQTDSSGNKSQNVEKIIKKDTKSPIINLENIKVKNSLSSEWENLIKNSDTNYSINIKLGNWINFNWFLAKVYDNFDAERNISDLLNITLNWNISSNNWVFDIKEIWNYEFKFNTKDSVWNESLEVTFTLIVEENIKNELKQSIDKVKEKLSSSSVSEWSQKDKLKSYLVDAEKILNNPNSTKQEIDDIINKMNKSIWGLVYASAPSSSSTSLAVDNRVISEKPKQENKEEKQENKEEKIKDDTSKNEEVIDKKEEIIDEKSESDHKTEIKTIEIRWEKRQYEISHKYSSCPMIPNIVWDYNKDFNISFDDIYNIKNLDEVQRLTKTGILNKNWVNNTNLFEPNRWITRAEFLAIVLKVHCYDVSKSVNILPYNDVDLDSWQARVVKVADDIWIIKGYWDWTFRPNNTISKIEAFWIMMKMRDITILEDYKDRYIDKKADWQAKPLSAAEYLWIINPEISNFEFKPNSKLNRNEMVKLIVDIIRLY